MEPIGAASRAYADFPKRALCTVVTGAGLFGAYASCSGLVLL
jgi:hypothetical protein